MAPLVTPRGNPPPEATPLPEKILFEEELVKISSMDALRLAVAKKSSIARRSDVVAGVPRTSLCFPRMRHLAQCRLVLKRFECRDELNLDLRRAEAVTLANLRGHKNLVRLYNHWLDGGGRGRKILCLLMEEVDGSSFEDLVKGGAGVSMGEVKALGLLHGLASGLSAIHGAGMVHGSVASRNVFLSQSGHVVLDNPGRVQLDTHRSQAMQEGALLSTSKLTAHWAPELFDPETKSATEASDVWAAALSVFECVAGQPAFAGGTRSIVVGLGQWSLLGRMPRLRSLCLDMAVIDPARRPAASEITSRVESMVAVEIQRVVRGWRARRLVDVLRRFLPRVQAMVKGALTRKDFYAERERMAGVSMLSLGSLERSSGFSEVDNQVMWLQAILLRKTFSTAFTRFRAAVVRCQAFVRGMIARRWYTSVMRHKHLMENHLLKMHDSKVEHKRLVSQLAGHFKAGGLPVTFQHLTSFDDFEHALGDEAAEHTVFMTTEARLKQHILIQQAKIDEANEKVSFLLKEGQRAREEQEAIKAALGPKYPELEPMVRSLTANLARVAELCAKSRTLPISILQHGSLAARGPDEMPPPFDPTNMCESILQYNERTFKAERPVVDLALSNGRQCFVSELLLAAGGVEKGHCPAFIEVYVSADAESWAPVGEMECRETDELQSYVFPGEQVCGYVRIAARMATNGEALVELRYISVKGQVQSKGRITVPKP